MAKKQILNEASGMISGCKPKNLKTQYDIAEKSIIPALRRNYDTAILAWQTTQGICL
jgi:hypothetical protein